MRKRHLALLVGLVVAAGFWSLRGPVAMWVMERGLADSAAIGHDEYWTERMFDDRQHCDEEYARRDRRAFERGRTWARALAPR